MANGQEDIFGLETALDIGQDTVSTDNELDLQSAIKVGSENELDLKSALSERDLTPLERLSFDLGQFGLTGTVQRPQTRFFSGINVFFHGLGDITSGFLQSAAAVDKRIADNLAIVAKKAEPGTIREDILSPGSVKDYALYKAGEDLRTMLEETFPENPEFQGEFLASVLPRGFGTVAGQAALAPLGLGVGSLVSTLAFSGIEYDNALKATGDENTAFNTMLLNMPVNALEQLPVFAAIGRINKHTGGGFTKLMKRLASTRTGVGVMEGTQEVVQEYFTNLIASETYDDTRDLIAGLDQAGGAGFIIGVVARSIGIGLRQRVNDPKATPIERAEALNTLNYLREETSRMINSGRIDRGQVEEALRLTGSRDEGARVGRQRARPIPPELQQEGARAEGARVGSARRRGFNPGNLFDPDIVPFAEAISIPAGEDFNKKQQSSFDVNSDQSGTVIDPTPDTPLGRFKRGFKKWFFPEGALPKKVWETAFNEGELNKDLKQMFFVLNDLKKSLKAEYSIPSFEEVFYSRKIPKETMTNLRGFLDGTKDASVLPERLRVPAWEMRSQIDQLSRRLLKLGFTEGDIDITIRENLGIYIHRTYKVHSQPDWAKKVSPDIKARARSSIEKAYKEAGIDLNPNQVENIINTILYRAKTSPVRVALEGNIGSLDLSPLKKRGDISEPIRALMGEELNPIVNYAKTVNAIANLIHQQKVLTELRDKFRGVYFWEPGDDNIPIDAVDMIAPKESQIWAPIAGLKTTPEIASAIRDKAPNWATQSNMLYWYLTLNAGAKFAKTVLNPATISRNVIGGSFFLMMNGHNPLGGNFQKGFEAAKSAFVNPNTAKGRKQILEYAELNLLGSSPQAREIFDLMGDISQAENYGQLQEFLMGRGLKARAARGIIKASDFYQAGDNLLRIIFHESELARLKEAGLGDTMSEWELKQEAAKITNKLYQNYDFVPEAVRRLRKAPIAPFIAFQYEIIRTSVNLVNQIKTEINSDNARLRQIGYSRLTGTVLTSSLGIALSTTSLMMLGIGEEEEEDVRRFAAPWDKNSTLIFFGSDRGEAKYLNFSYIDPYEYLKDPLLLLLTGRGEEGFLNSFKESLLKLMEPLFQEEIFVNAAREVISNRTEDDTQIFNPQDQLFTKAQKILGHLWEAVSPGFLRNTSNLYEAATEDASKTNREVPTELLGALGFRVTTVDFKRGLSFKARDYNKDKRDSKRLYNTVKFDEGSTALERERAFQEANIAFRGIFKEMSRDIEAARRKGVSWSVIKKTLKGNGISEAEIERLRFNRFDKFNR